MNQQYPQPNQPMPQYAPPQKPYIDPAKAKKEKTDAINGLGEKISLILKTHPVLAAIEKNAEIFSYIATAACSLLTIVLMTMGNFSIPFGIIAVIFGFFAISRKKMLPLTVAMTAYSLFSLVCFINSIVHIVEVARYSFYFQVMGGAVLNMIFSLLELGAIGFLTYLTWIYHLAAVPEKPMQQPYYGQPNQAPQYTHNQTTQYTQPAPPPVPVPAKTANNPILEPIAPPPQPNQPNQPTQAQTVQPAEPAQNFNSFAAQIEAPSNTAISHKFCTSCGTENNAEAVFCKNCGKKF